MRRSKIRKEIWLVKVGFLLATVVVAVGGGGVVGVVGGVVETSAITAVGLMLLSSLFANRWFPLYRLSNLIRCNV